MQGYNNLTLCARLKKTKTAKIFYKGMERNSNIDADEQEEMAHMGLNGGRCTCITDLLKHKKQTLNLAVAEVITQLTDRSDR